MKQKHQDHTMLIKLFFRLLPFQVLMLIITAANSIIDSLFASNCVGTVAMSAIGFFSPLNHLLFALSITLVSGSQLLVGKALGRNRSDEVHAYFTTDLIVSVVVSLVTSLLFIIASVTGLFHIFIKDASELEALNRYLLGQAAGVPALVLGQQLFSFLSLENQTKRTTAASICCIIVNLIMDTLLVMVLGMGTLGLGLGTASGQWAFLIVMAQFYFSGKSGMKFIPSALKAEHAKTIIQCGYPGAISRFLEMFRCFIVNILIIKYVGSVGLSAFAAVNSVMAVFWTVPFGMVAVLRMLLGISIGEEDRKSLADIMRIATRHCVMVQAGIVAFIMLMSYPFTLMFYQDTAEKVFELTRSGFLILSLCMPFSVLSLNFSCYAQAAGKKFLCHSLPAVDGFGGVVLGSLIFIPLLGMNGLYVANIFNGVICLLVVLGFSFSANRHFPKTMEELIVMPDDFGAADDERIDIEVRELAEVLSVSQQVTDFCKERGIEPRRAYFAGLALEEMAGNVVDHGFAADNRQHYLDIRVIHKDDDIILRLRDNCSAFDPMERMKILGDEDMVSNIGLRIVYNISKDVQYQNLLGLNVLTIRI